MLVILTTVYLLNLRSSTVVKQSMSERLISTCADEERAFVGGDNSGEVLLLEDNVIIPANLARPIVYTSQIMLLTALLSALDGMWLFCILCIILWFTSTNFWRDPRLGYRRTLDYMTVLTVLVYATIVALHLPLKYTMGWFIFLGAIAVIFGLNEARYWMNPEKSNADYKSIVCAHLTGVHLIGNLAAWWLLYGIYKSGRRCCQ